MPTYEYRCPEGHEFEKFQRMSDLPVAQCPTCGQDASRLLSAGAGLLFKGEGFYITDYRSDSYKEAAAKEKPEKSKAGGEQAGGDGGGGDGRSKKSKEVGGKSGGSSAGKPGGSSAGSSTGGGE